APPIGAGASQLCKETCSCGHSSLHELSVRPCRAQLPEQPQLVLAAPELDDLAPLDPVDVDAAHRDALAGRGDPHPLAALGAAVGPPRHHTIPLGNQILDL